MRPNQTAGARFVEAWWCEGLDLGRKLADEIDRGVRRAVVDVANRMRFDSVSDQDGDNVELLAYEPGENFYGRELFLDGSLGIVVGAHHDQLDPTLVPVLLE